MTTFLPVQISAQERPFDATVCALLLHPERYSEGLVSVEGLITLGPEEFLLHDPTCGDEHGKLWLEFAGDVPSPEVVNGPHQRSAKSPMAAALPLTRDRDFDALRKLLDDAQKKGTRKMLRATLIGKYFPGRLTKTASGASFLGGYGHLGCCSLLVIEEVAKVSGELEAPVDFSPIPPLPARSRGKGCTVTDIPVPPREDEDQLQRNSRDEEYQYLHDPKDVAARAIAVQQNVDADSVEKRLETDSTDLEQSSYNWQTLDGLTSYRVVVNKPYWLWQTAQRGDAVIWVPKQITRIECQKPENKLNLPILH